MTKLRSIVLAVLVATIGLASHFVAPCAVEEYNGLTFGHSYRPVRGQSPESHSEAHRSRKRNHPNRHHELRRGSSPSPFSRRAPTSSRRARRDSKLPGKTGSSSAPGDTLTTEIRLTVGATEQVTVNASGPLLQTQDANISTELTSKQLEELPLNLRNVLYLCDIEFRREHAGRPAVVGGRRQ